MVNPLKQKVLANPDERGTRERKRRWRGKIQTAQRNQRPHQVCRSAKNTTTCPNNTPFLVKQSNEIVHGEESISQGHITL